jgi:hypothetical protein
MNRQGNSPWPKLSESGVHGSFKPALESAYCRLYRLLPCSCVRLTTHENIEVGPTFLWLMLGAGFGCVAIVLGFVGLLIRKVAKDGDPK